MTEYDLMESAEPVKPVKPQKKKGLHETLRETLPEAPPEAEPESTEMWQNDPKTIFLSVEFFYFAILFAMLLWTLYMVYMQIRSTLAYAAALNRFTDMYEVSLKLEAQMYNITYGN